MAFAFTLDSTVPAEGGLVSAGAGNIRNLTAALIERLNSFFIDANTSPLTGKTGALMSATSFSSTVSVTGGGGLVVTSPGAVPTIQTSVYIEGSSARVGWLDATQAANSRILEFEYGAEVAGTWSIRKVNDAYNATTRLLIGDMTGAITIRNGLTISAAGASITGGISIVTGGLTVTAGDANFAAGIKQTGTVVARFENTVITRPAGSAGSGVEIGAGIIQSYNATGAAYTTLLIQSTLTTFAQGGVVAPSIRTATTTGVVFATGVFVTLFAPTVKGLYMVSVTNEANGATGPNGLGFLLFNGGTDINLIGQFLSFANNGFGVSAGNIQYKQQSVASATMTWTYQLIG